MLPGNSDPSCHPWWVLNRLEDGVLEDGEVESSNGEVEVNVEATSRGDDR